MEDLRQSEEWAKYLNSQGWEVEEVASNKGEVVRIYIKRIPLLGSVIKIQRPDAIPPVEKIDEIAKKHRALFVKLEPACSSTGETAGSPDPEGKERLEPLTGFTRDPAPCLPTKNTIIDLTRSEEKLWKKISQDTRHDIKEARKNQIAVTNQPGNKEFDRALESFAKLVSETGRRQGFWTPNLKQLKALTGSFGENAFLFLACPSSAEEPRRRNPSGLNSLTRRVREWGVGESVGWAVPTGRQEMRRRLPTIQPNSRPTAGFLILTHADTAYYHRTATSINGRELNAAYLLMWKTILKAKGLGLKYLNLGSIYDPRYHKATKSWQGFSIFKKKWRGDEVEYPQPLIKCYRPLGKLIHKLDTLQFG